MTLLEWRRSCERIDRSRAACLRRVPDMFSVKAHDNVFLENHAAKNFAIYQRIGSNLLEFDMPIQDGINDRRQKACISDV
ncbi:hypothetical protein [Burkholderia stabilis]|uniref:hypothetical protein n=1 Tax=Burkholderia stabilis TaxID=95485 RepID=UPI001591E3D8|nr:hypothetical protein [Burkholderia stabilis]